MGDGVGKRPFWMHQLVEYILGVALVASGTQSPEPLVPLLFSEILAQGMADAGREAELFVYPGDDHNLSANLRTALSRSVAFFDQHVKAAPAAPTP